MWGSSVRTNLTLGNSFRKRLSNAPSKHPGSWSTPSHQVLSIGNCVSGWLPVLLSAKWPSLRDLEWPESRYLLSEGTTCCLQTSSCPFLPSLKSPWPCEYPIPILALEEEKKVLTTCAFYWSTACVTLSTPWTSMCYFLPHYLVVLLPADCTFACPAPWPVGSNTPALWIQNSRCWFLLFCATP